MNCRRILILILGILCGGNSLRAELYQTISVNIFPREIVEVDHRRIAMADLVTELKATITGDRRVTVMLCVPLGIKKSERERIMALCREAGVTAFTIISKA